MKISTLKNFPIFPRLLYDSVSHLIAVEIKTRIFNLKNVEKCEN